MRLTSVPLAALFLAVSCASSGPPPVPPAFVSAAAPGTSVEAERDANRAAYRFLYLPEQARLAARHRGQWLAVAGGKVVPSNGQAILPAATMEEAVAAAAEAKPDAKHRFVFQVGEEGDVTWPLGGCELPHVLGTHFMALLERDDVRMNLSPKAPSVVFVRGDQTTELAVAGEDTRMYVRPEVGPPGAAGAEGAAYCVSTGFGGFATLSSASAAGLELWEIPGTALVDGAAQRGECRRARARFNWPNTALDFTVPVAIWPK